MLKLAYPAKPWKVNQGFGENPANYAWLGINGHNGIDVGVPTGTLVSAAHDGIVVFTGADGSGGETIILRTTEAYDGVYYKTIYVHLKSGTYKVKPGDVVTTGQPLAESNNTGWSSGPHLHFGLKPVARGENDWEWYNTEQNNGFKGAIDPAPFFTGEYAEDIWKLKQKINILKQLVELWKKIRSQS
jgi:murein DD-endopeptidase MepM/ murein hydrolase activator NlpD